MRALDDLLALGAVFLDLRLELAFEFDLLDHHGLLI
jgi:hypothetical protein